MCFGSVDAWNCCSRRVSMCNSCSNCWHRCAPFVELLLDAHINVQELYRRRPPVCSIRRARARSCVSLCNTCINGSHWCAPIVELFLQACIVVQQLRQRKPSVCSNRRTLPRSVYQCARVLPTAVIGATPNEYEFAIYTCGR